MQWFRSLVIKIIGLVVLPLLGFCIAIVVLFEHLARPFKRQKPTPEPSQTLSTVLGDILYRGIGNFITDILNTPHPR